MGLVPIYVYDDTPWVPYADLFPRLGYITTVRALPQLLANISSQGNADISARESRIAEVRNSHFMPEGIIRQISLFMVHGCATASVSNYVHTLPPCMIRHIYIYNVYLKGEICREQESDLRCRALPYSLCNGCGR